MEGSKPRTKFRVRPMLMGESGGTLSAVEDNAGVGRADGGLKVGNTSWCFDQTPLDMPKRLPDKYTPDEERGYTFGRHSSPEDGFVRKRR